jgi:hypothetical protein
LRFAPFFPIIAIEKQEDPMEEQNQPQVTSSAPVEISSFGTRAVNVLTAPGDLYAEVARAPVQTSSWLVPFLVIIALIVLMLYSFTSNAVLYDQMLKPQHEEMQKQVADGKMTQQQADQAAQFMQNKGLIFAFGAASAVLITTIFVFGAPLVYWVVIKGALKYTGNYKKVLEVYGLSMIIGIVGMLVSIIMMNMMESMYAQPSGAFFLRESYDQGNFVHNLAASLNVFSVWQVAVTGIGLSAVSGKSRGAGIGLAFGLWIIYVLIASYMGWGAR